MIQITGNTFPVKEQLKALGGKWNNAARCWEVPDDQADAARALVGATPVYNSPPPEDLGTVDPAALAAKYGRTAAAGAVVRSFTGRGKQPDDNGTVFLARGHRFVKVANGRPRYYSRDMLEDFDMFDDEPGHQYQLDAVEVEPTAEERAEDEARATAKADAVDRVKRLEALMHWFRDQGQRPDGPIIPEGETVPVGQGQTIYGGGRWFVLGLDWIWYVQNNGGDGDNWESNNVRTGGAGAIGWRVPATPELAASVRDVTNHKRADDDDDDDDD